LTHSSSSSLFQHSSRYTYLLYHSTTTTHISPLSLHDALPICQGFDAAVEIHLKGGVMDPVADSTLMAVADMGVLEGAAAPLRWIDRKSTRLNSSHVSISYAVFCLKKKKQILGVF